MAAPQLRILGPDGKYSLEPADQLLARILIPVGDGYVTVLQALADRPTQAEVARALAAVSASSVDLTPIRDEIAQAAAAARGDLAAALPNDMPRAVRRSQLLRAVSQTLPGGLAAFLAADPPLVLADPDAPSSIAYYHEPFALPGGVLASLLTTYCRTTLGMSAPAAAAQVTALFALAATLTPST